MSEPTLRQLRYFLAVAEEQHFGQAAARCAVTQPALSMQIRELEQTVGAVLVERTRHGAKLTDAGARLAQRATKVLHEIRDLVDDVRGSAGVLRGKIRVGVIPSIAPYLLPPLLPKLREAYPELDLHVRETQTERLLDELASGRLDCLILALPIDRDDVKTLALFEDRFLLAQPKTRPAPSRRRAIDPALRAERLLLLEEGHCLRDQILQYCNKRALKELESFEAASLTTLVQLVANDFGVTLVPELCVGVESRYGGVRLVRFASPEPHRTVALAWRASSPRSSDFEALGAIIKATGTEIIDKTLPKSRRPTKSGSESGD